MSISLTRVFLPILLVLAFVVRWEPTRTLRLAPDERDLGASRWLIDDPDTCQHMRRIELAVATDKVVSFDRFVNFPEGGEIPAMPLFDTAVAGIAQHFLRSPSGDVALGQIDEADLEDFAIKLAPILGLLMVLATWIAARNIVSGPRGDAAALVAAAVVAFHPACAAVSSAGVLAPIALACTLFALLIRSTARCVSAERIPTALVDAMIGGGSVGLLCTCTSLGIVLFLPCWVAQLVHTARSEGEQLARAIRAGLIFCLVAAFIARMPLNEGPWEEGSGMVRGFASGVSMLLFLSTAPFIVMLLTARKDKQRLFGTLCFVAALVLMAWQLPQLWRDIAPAARWFASSATLIGDVAPGFALFGSLVPSSIVLIAVLAACVWSWPDRTQPITMALLVIAAFVGVTALVLPGALPLAVIACACLVARAVDLGLASDRERTRVTSRWIAATLPLVLAFVAAIPWLQSRDEALREERIDFVAGLRWIRNKTESGGAWNSPRSAYSFGVMSMTHDGPLVQYHARRPALLSPWAVASAPRDVESGRGSWSESMDRFVHFLRASQTRYVVVPGAKYHFDRRSPFISTDERDGRHPMDPSILLMAGAPDLPPRVGPFERVYSSPRLVDERGHAPADGKTGDPAVAIFRLDAAPAQPVQSEMRPR